MNRRLLRLGIAVDGVGAHAGASRVPGAADAVLDAERLVRLVQTAERGGLDFVTIDDNFDPPAGPAALPVRLDALLAMARVAPVTTSIGLLPTVTTTHTEPFHVAKNLATLDLVSGGRAGWRVAVTTTGGAADAFGRKGAAPIAELHAEAEDTIEVVSRLWDSWEDDAVIRDVATGRYVDRDKLHYIDFEGPFFSVRGPSITPRPPQGQPVVAVDDDGGPATAMAARRADIVFIEAGDRPTASARSADIRRRVAAAGRDPDAVIVLAGARIGRPGERAELDRLADDPAAEAGFDLVDRAGDVADVLDEWFLAGAVDGFVVRLDTLPATLDWFVDEVAADLVARGRLGERHGAVTLRERFGLARPANRYAATAGAT